MHSAMRHQAGNSLGKPQPIAIIGPGVEAERIARGVQDSHRVLPGAQIDSDRIGALGEEQ